MVNVTNGKLIRLLVDDEPFDVRYGDLRQPRAGARPPRRRAAPGGRVELADRATRYASTRPGSSRSPSARSPRSTTRSSRSTSALRVVVQSELVANEPLPRDERARRSSTASAIRPARCDLRAPSSPSATARTTSGDPRPPDAGERSAHGRRRWTTWSTGPTTGTSASRSEPDLAAYDGQRRSSRPGSRCGSSSSSPTAGPRGARCRRCATRSRRRWPRREHTGWDGLVAAPARVPRRLLGARRRRDRGRPRAAAGGALRAVPRRSRRAPGPSSARSRPRG